MTPLFAEPLQDEKIVDDVTGDNTLFLQTLAAKVIIDIYQF